MEMRSPGVLMCCCHLRSGRERSHQGSLRTLGVSDWLLRRCCDTRRVRLAALTGRMAFLRLGNGGDSGNRHVDGLELMCSWLLYLNETTVKAVCAFSVSAVLLECRLL